MRKSFCLFLFVSLCSITALAQVSGNRVYENQGAQQGAQVQRRYPGYGGATTEQVISEQENLLVTTYQFIEAKVLTSVETKEYVAVFGMAQEADSLPKASKKLQEQIAAFQSGLGALGIRPEDTYLDFITQNRVYDYQVKGSTAREKVSGFQVKENFFVRYKDPRLLDQITPIAAQAGIFDLIKVDYVTSDLNAVRAQLAEEAMKVLKQKEESYTKLGLKLQPVTVMAENFDAFQPSEAYNSYKAYETGNVDEENYRVVERRKNSTFFFEPLNPGQFDKVLNPVGLQPQVQCTFILRVKYFVDRHETIVRPVQPDKKP
ncbi:MAG TPA: SIMPL domain-containing protein [Pyrinomonadaceae bacterium]|nr:SIMPL domain-containing protein [Pyrinomonadaceae bacterium]